MALFVRRRNHIRGMGERLKRLTDAANAVIESGDEDRIRYVRDEAWDFQKELLLQVQKGDQQAAGALFDVAKISLVSELGAQAWLRSIAAGQNLAVALSVIDVVLAQEERVIPPGFLGGLRRVPDVVAYAAHRAGVPLAAPMIVEAITSVTLGERMLERSLGGKAVEELSQITEVQRERIELARRDFLSRPSDIAELGPFFEARIREEFDSGSGPSSAYALTSATTQALDAAVVAKRTLLYITGGPHGGAAIRIRVSNTEDRLADSIEIPEFDLPQIEDRISHACMAFEDAKAGKIGKRGLAKMLEETLNWIGATLWNVVLGTWPDLSKTRLALVPVGEVAALPLFAAIVGDAPICSQMDLTITPSARALLLSSLLPAPSKGQVFIAADPWYGENAIPGTVDEAHQVADVYGVRPVLLRTAERHPEQPAPLRSFAQAPHDTELGAQTRAEHTKFTDKLSGASVIHLACHGKLNQTTPLKSSLYLGTAIPLDQLLGNDMQSGSIIVLSACQLGGIGLDVPNEQLGFPAALLATGARSVVGALWPVPDGADTALLMKEFHQRLISEPSSVALGRTIGDFHAAGVSPSLWGSFCHFGS